MDPFSQSVLCRLCLYRSEVLIGIFDENGKHGYIAAEVIEDLLQLHVRTDDGYPQQVCTKCLDKLTDFKVFKTQCYDSRLTFDKEFGGLCGSSEDLFPSASCASKCLVGSAEETVTDDYLPQKGAHLEIKVEKVDEDEEPCNEEDATEGIPADLVFKTESIDCDEAFTQSIVAGEVVDSGTVSPADIGCGTGDGPEVGRIRVRDLWESTAGTGIVPGCLDQGRGYSLLQQHPRDDNVEIPELSDIQTSGRSPEPQFSKISLESSRSGFSLGSPETADGATPRPGKRKASRKTSRKATSSGIPGVLNPKKKMGPGCSGCRFSCDDKITYQERRVMFEEFWKVGDHSKQWDFLNALLVFGTPKARRASTKNDGEFRKQSSTKYYLTASEKRLKVCQKMYLDTFGISRKWVDTIKRKIQESPCQKISPDMRGRNKKTRLKR